MFLCNPLWHKIPLVTWGPVQVSTRQAPQTFKGGGGGESFSLDRLFTSIRQRVTLLQYITFGDEILKKSSISKEDGTREHNNVFSVGGKKCDRHGTLMEVNYRDVLRGRPGDQICFLRPEGTNLAWKQFRAIWLFTCVWISKSFFHCTFP